MEERITQRDVLMTILKNIDGRYNPKHKFINNFLLRFSSTGLYRNEESILKLINSDAEKMKKSFESVKQINLRMVLFKLDKCTLMAIKESITPTYTNAINEASLFCNRFYDIRENGGSFGRELISKDIFKSIIDIQKTGIILEKASIRLLETTHIDVETKMNDYRIDTLIDTSNKIIESIEQNHKQMTAEFKKHMTLFHAGMLNQHNIHCI